MSLLPSKAIASVAGGIVAAVASTLCCAGPLVAVALGVSGAGLAQTFEPLRPAFVVMAVGALAYGHWAVRKEEQRACEPGSPCVSPVVRRRTKRVLWLGTVLAVPLLTFPWWSPLVIR
jgi:mercuric ion transport protein